MHRSPLDVLPVGHWLHSVAAAWLENRPVGQSKHPPDDCAEPLLSISDVSSFTHTTTSAKARILLVPWMARTTYLPLVPGGQSRRHAWALLELVMLVPTPHSTTPAV